MPETVFRADQSTLMREQEVPTFQPCRHEPRYDEFVSFIEISGDEAGDQHCCSLYLPTGTTHVDIRPTGDAPTVVDGGLCATAS